MRQGPSGEVERGEDLALLGHDLRAALGDMRAGLALLTRQDVPAELHAVMAHCQASAESLARLIDHSIMVCLGQAEAERSLFDDIDSRAFLTALRQRWQGLAAETGHHLELIAGPELPDTLRLDRTALERVLANLIGNALRHTPPGAIRVSVVASGDLLLFSVEDDGPGFPARYLPMLERDFALPPEARPQGGGLGLQSVKRLVTAMGGQCQARNKDGGGAVVSLCLPLQTTALAAGQRPALPPVPNLGGLRLLLADDSAAARDLVTGLGRQAGATVDTVASGDAALQVLSQAPLPDVVILDVEMPGMTGVEVLRWLRARADRAADLPVLALTSHIGAPELAALHEAGADVVLTKPLLCPLELGRAVLRAQERRALARQGADDALLRLQQIAGPVAARELFQRLEEDLTHAATGLATAAASGDLGAIRGHSHVIIALAGTAGDSALHGDAVNLNQMAQGQHPAERVVALAARLDQPLAQLVDRVRRFARAQATPPPSGSVSP